MDIQGTRKTSYSECHQPGDFYWSPSNDPHRISMLCPCGCGNLIGAKVKGEGAWQWNGDLDKPTLSPSIRVLSGCCWHGYLIDGIFKSC